MSQVVVQPSQEILVVQVGQTTGGPGGGGGVALGETSSTAYRGDRGKEAYDHSQVPHNKGLVGLGNVDNTSDTNKPISTATADALATKAGIGVANIWTEEQTLDKAFAKRLRLEIVSRTTPGDWPIGVSVVIANLPNVSTTIDCSTLGINSQGPCIDAGCQWSDALCNGTNQTTCVAVDGCSWGIYYCADITTATSCNNSQNCSWDEENEVCTGGIENENCEGTPIDFGCYGSIEDLTGMGFELSTNFADKQFGAIRNITGDSIYLLMESELAITVPPNSSSQFVRLGNAIVRIDQ